VFAGGAFRKRTPIVTATRIVTTKDTYVVARAQVDIPSTRTTSARFDRPETTSARVGIAVSRDEPQVRVSPTFCTVGIRSHSVKLHRERLALHGGHCQLGWRGGHCPSREGGAPEAWTLLACNHTDVEV
jgi:hypothetical protein